jgi:hypothetical protein
MTRDEEITHHISHVLTSLSAHQLAATTRSDRDASAPLFSSEIQALRRALALMDANRL